MNTGQLHSEYITGIRIDESLGRYRLSCKVGTYCVFGHEQISNQIHNHDCYELCLILSGTGTFNYNETLYNLREGDILVADPHVPHEILASQKESLVLLYIFITITENERPSKIVSIEDNWIDGFIDCHNIISAQRQLLAYINFIEMYNSPQKKFHQGTQEAIKNLVLESLASLSKTAKAPKVEIIKNILENALDYIDQNLHTRIRVNEIAANSCTTVRNLEYLFKRQLDKTVVGYINEKKTDLACHYLSMFFNVSDTAEMVGINNVSQFSRMFKKYKKISPQDFQKTTTGGTKGIGRRI
jgi:AraC-like DNA-binding protein/mannose-6-phosphate isomerase-like protein (cupin superfamily)